MEILTRCEPRRRNSVDHCTVPQDRKVERRPVERDQLRRERCDLFHERRDQLLLGSLSDVRCSERVYGPVTGYLTVGNQRPDTNNRVVNVLGKLIAQFGPDFIIAFANMTIRSGKAFEIRNGFDVPNNNIADHRLRPSLSRLFPHSNQ
jgi:hypothetical protein